MAKSETTMGSDPEFMLKNRDGELVSAIGRVKGTKDNKIDLGNGYKLFYDNVLAEMNMVPAKTEKELIENIYTGLRLAARAVHPYVLSLGASAVYPAAECKHKDAKVFGCEAEYCAYKLTQIMPPTCENTFRSAGGHIHLGAIGESYPLMAPVKDNDYHDRNWGRVWVVRMLDLFVGIPSILMDSDPSSAPRRNLYGKAGSHRPKEEYGVEYRATGNFWLSSPKMTSLIYKLCMFTVNFVGKRAHEKLGKEYDPEEVCNAINMTNYNGAIKVMENLVKKHLPQELYVDIFKMCEPMKVNMYREWGI